MLDAQCVRVLSQSSQVETAAATEENRCKVKTDDELAKLKVEGAGIRQAATVNGKWVNEQAEQSLY